MPLASRIDHTLLKPEARPEHVEDLVGEAVRYGFHSVCVHGRYVGLASKLLEGSKPLVCTVIGFPSGALVEGAKAAEASRMFDRLDATSYLSSALISSRNLVTVP